MEKISRVPVCLLWICESQEGHVAIFDYDLSAWEFFSLGRLVGSPEIMAFFYLDKKSLGWHFFLEGLKVFLRPANASIDRLSKFINLFFIYVPEKEKNRAFLVKNQSIFISARWIRTVYWNVHFTIYCRIIV